MGSTNYDILVRVRLYSEFSYGKYHFIQLSLCSAIVSSELMIITG